MSALSWPKVGIDETGVDGDGGGENIDSDNPVKEKEGFLPYSTSFLCLCVLGLSAVLAFGRKRKRERAVMNDD